MMAKPQNLCPVKKHLANAHGEIIRPTAADPAFVESSCAEVVAAALSDDVKLLGKIPFARLKAYLREANVKFNPFDTKVSLLEVVRRVACEKHGARGKGKNNKPKKNNPIGPKKKSVPRLLRRPRVISERSLP